MSIEKTLITTRRPSRNGTYMYRNALNETRIVVIASPLDYVAAPEGAWTRLGDSPEPFLPDDPEEPMDSFREVTEGDLGKVIEVSNHISGPYEKARYICSMHHDQRFEQPYVCALEDSKSADEPAIAKFAYARFRLKSKPEPEYDMSNLPPAEELTINQDDLVPGIAYDSLPQAVMVTKDTGRKIPAFLYAVYPGADGTIDYICGATENLRKPFKSVEVIDNDEWTMDEEAFERRCDKELTESEPGFQCQCKLCQLERSMEMGSMASFMTIKWG